MYEYVGFDISKEETSFCVMDEAGKIMAQGKAFSDPRSLFCSLAHAHAVCEAYWSFIVHFFSPFSNAPAIITTLGSMAW